MAHEVRALRRTLLAEAGNPNAAGNGAGNNSGDNRRRTFPLDRETITDFLKPVSFAAFTAICAFIVLPTQGKADEAANKLFWTLLMIYIPIGLVSLIIAYAATRYENLVGPSAGLVLFEICSIHVLGCVITVHTFKESSPYPAIGVAAFLVLATLLGWRHCCSYPKFLRCGIIDDDSNTLEGTTVQQTHSGPNDDQQAHSGPNDDQQAHSGPNNCSTCFAATTVQGRALQLADEGDTACQECGGAVLPSV